MESIAILAESLALLFMGVTVFRLHKRQKRFQETLAKLMQVVQDKPMLLDAPEPSAPPSAPPPLRSEQQMKEVMADVLNTLVLCPTAVRSKTFKAIKRQWYGATLRQIHDLLPFFPSDEREDILRYFARWSVRMASGDFGAEDT